jgi:hypothetical protein
VAEIVHPACNKSPLKQRSADGLGQKDLASQASTCLVERDVATIKTATDALYDTHDVVWKDALDGIVTLGGEQALELLHHAQHILEAHDPAAVMKCSWIEEAIEQVRADIGVDEE